MNIKTAVALCTLLSGVALAAKAPTDAAWEKALDAYAQKHDIMDFGQYRTGIIDRNELAHRVAKVFNAEAFRTTGTCKNNAAGQTHTFSCDLTIPVIDKVVATVKLIVALDKTTVTLDIGSPPTGTHIPLMETATYKFFAEGLKISIADKLAKFGPPGMGAIASMLVAELDLKAIDKKDGTSDICINFKVGMAGPFGVAIPGMPAPADIPLICETVSMSAPKLGFFQKVLKVVTFGYWY